MGIKGWKIDFMDHDDQYMVRFYRLRSKTVSRNGAEMTVEVRMDRRGDLVGGMLDVDGVHDATLVACQTEAGS